jgi:uncharacterized protein (DUF433 family)
METLTTAEIAALFNVDEHRVRKDVEHGIMGAARPPRFRFADVVYFLAVKDMKLELSIADRKMIHGVVAKVLKSARVPRAVQLTPVIDLKLGPVVRQVRTRLGRFEAWKRGLGRNSGVLGGEPVFPKSRLAVRHVGEMIRRGVPADEIREDYPYLKDEDLEFAPLYAMAYPRVGRPRVDQAPSR